jgi:endo-1,4-beta-xylanase
MKNLFYLILLFTSFVQCGKEEVVVKPPVVTPVTPINVDCSKLRLKELANAANNSDFAIGIQFETNQRLDNEKFMDTVTTFEIDRVTTYTSMHDILSRNATTGALVYNFSKLDRELAYAESKGILLHAHCLFYPLSNVNTGVAQQYICADFMVNWPNETQAQKDEFRRITMEYIKTVTAKYKGRIKSYDITNELFNSVGAQNTWLRKRFTSDTEFYKFVADMFIAANEGDPTATYFYNDYGQENSPSKGGTIRNQLKAWIAAGVPIGGYGVQFHTFAGVNKINLENALAMAAETGLKIHISELDVSINQSDNVTSATPTMLQTQRVTFRNVVDAYKTKVPKAQQFGITMWDSSDEFTWFIKAGQRSVTNFEAPTIYSKDQLRKPAFYGFAEGLSGKLYNCGN